MRYFHSSYNNYFNNKIFHDVCNISRKIVLGECFQPIDLVFAHDSSGSVKTGGFQKIKDFTKTLVSSFKIGVQETHVGVIVFSHIAKVAIRLDETFDKATLLDKIDNISYLGYTTATDDALRLSNTEMFSLKGGVRQNVPLVLVVLTDGNCTACKEDVSIPANALKAKGVNIFAIAVGNKVDIKEIHSFVSSPPSEHLLQVDGLDKLKTVIKQLSYKGCQGKFRISRPFNSKRLSSEFKIKVRPLSQSIPLVC